MPGIESAINRSIDVWPMVWEDRMEAAMHALHTRPDAPAADAKPTKEKQ